MILRGWQIDGFGAFRDRASPELDAGLTVLHGPNEAGKSTLLAFIRGVLFGFPDKRSRGSQPLYEPADGGALGGRLYLEQDGRRYAVERRARGPNKPAALLDADGQPVPDRELSDLLGGADETLFRNVFGFSLWELQEPDSLTEDSVRDRIFSGAIAGAGRSARQAAQDLDRAAAALYRPDGRSRKHRIYQLLQEIQGLDRELEEARRAARAYPDKVAAEQAAQAEVDRLGREMQGHDARKRELEALLRLSDPWSARARALQRLEALTGCSFPREQAVQPDPELAELKRRTDALSESLALQRQRLTDAGELAAQQRDERARLEETLDTLGEGWTAERVEAFRQPIPEREEVRAWERALSDAEARVEKAQEQGREAERRAQESRQRHAQLARELEAAQDPPPELQTLQTRQRELESLRTRAGELARRRDGAGYARTLAEQAGERVQDVEASRPGVTGYWAALVVAALAVIGAAAALGAQQYWLAAAAAAGGIGLAGVVIGFLGEQRVRLTRRLTRAERERKQRERDARAYERELQDLEAQALESAQALGFAAVPEAAELTRTATELDHDLERRRRLDALARQVAEQGEDAEAREAAQERAAEAVRTAERELDRLSSGWADWKAARGFPAALGPQGVLDFAERVRQAQETLRKLRQLENKRQQLLESAAAWDAQAQDVLAARGRDDNLTGAGLIQAVEETAAAIAEEQAARSEAERAEAALAQEAGNDPARAAELRRALAGGAAQDWRDELERLDAYLAAQQGARDDALRQLQEATRARQEVERSDRIAELETRRNQLVGEVARSYRQWQVYASARGLIEETLERFERERQPAVFARASERFARFTCGRYAGIRLDRDGQGFAVVDARDRRLAPLDLSRGTREQLYLAVRLGLIEEFVRRGTSLPLVMDEILVNFDPERMTAVIRELAAVAQDHQILLFTCHPEIAQRVAATAPDSRVVQMAA